MITAPRQFLHPHPTPVTPVRCRKCGRWFAPQTPYRTPALNMAGGIRFTTHGRAFTQRGLNYMGDDGTCPSCNCDHPPNSGSGKNYSACALCPDGKGPASVLISFIGQTFFTCQQFCGSNSSRLSIDATLGDYCAPMGSYLGNCLATFADPTPGVLNSYFATDTSCSTPFPTPIYFGGTVLLSAGGWSIVLYGNAPAPGIIIKLFESAVIPAANCTDSVILTSTGLVTAMCNPRNDQYDVGGAAVVSPQFSLCP
jgi:hypothetical protein